MLQSGVNFINILCAAFLCVDPKSTKMTVKPLAIGHFAPLGSTLIKASSKHVCEIDPLFYLYKKIGPFYKCVFASI